ncbi:MAG TPA: FlgT C-terminal domain-containing protein [Pyrinomonadaceae bacterium]|nr:FlgT C-terminal domain-containing protein [Pyrinomonadaceae bacterium]
MRQTHKEIPVRSYHTPPARRLLPFVLLFCAFGHAPASAQTADALNGTGGAEKAATVPAAQAAPRPPVETGRQRESACGGFIEQTPQPAAGQIVGAEQERERSVFAQGELVFIDAGAQSGVRAGQEFSVVRPRGQFTSEFTRKHGSLGVFTQEVGRLRVVRVRDRVSVAEVTNACVNLLFGDLLRPVQQREVPPARGEVALDRFAEPTGKQTGRIVLARDGREMLTRDNVVYIDLGAEDNVHVGDYLTVYRPEGHGVLVKYGDEINSNYLRGFESEELRGGGFSAQAHRVRDVDGPKRQKTVKTPDIKRRRPAVPRKVVGEVVVTHVEGRTATAVVTRVAQEIHTGDAVEVQ